MNQFDVREQNKMVQSRNDNLLTPLDLCTGDMMDYFFIYTNAIGAEGEDNEASGLYEI